LQFYLRTKYFSVPFLCIYLLCFMLPWMKGFTCLYSSPDREWPNSKQELSVLGVSSITVLNKESGLNKCLLNWILLMFAVSLKFVQVEFQMLCAYTKYSWNQNRLHVFGQWGYYWFTGSFFFLTPLEFGQLLGFHIPPLFRTSYFILYQTTKRCSIFAPVKLFPFYPNK
jgi:hypothetical protein